MVVIGDFNAILEVEDRTHGTVVQDQEIRDFREFMEESGMTELKAIGRSFTWTNSHVFSKIDRAIVNGEWMSKMPITQVHVLDPYFSDHSPLCIELGSQQKIAPRPFRFLNYLADDPNFEMIVADSWQMSTNAGHMKKVWLKLKHAKQAMKSLNTKEYPRIVNKIKGIRSELQATQQQMRTPTQDPCHFEVEKELRLQLEKWDAIEESIYKQKSRVQWLNLGDSNSAYFFASIKNRRAQNQIKTLTNAAGDIVQTEKGIEEEIINFYQGLLGQPILYYLL
ncbi:PREDICTED: uncharacterized protein LOC109234650 [Nicotiana attenuata]|uniref:uncharacterized protein LOC109234650 n=1 Tax=Nicotiana attenuata TaxID=49451 RepID=UPI00090525FF|nr:PREDICTED: uncharacterized protein LOC109234650 [Nicotiana attenuata]